MGLMAGVMLWNLAGCKLSDDSKLKKGWHNLLARDNIWFNANERLKASVRALRSQHEDSYDKVLNVFPFGTEAQRKANAGEMDEIIKKCSKVIVKYPISKWVDDCYLILGKAQFFKGDAYASVETFQTLTSKFKNSKLKDEATLWIILSYIYMNKPEEAEAIVGLIQSDVALSKGLSGELAAINADIKIRQEKYQPAIEPMRQAFATADSRWKKARYAFILGQLYLKNDQHDSANYFFRKVNRYNPPYDMAFNAKMNLAKSVQGGNKSQTREVKRLLRRMLKDDKNISFYDQIYFELGQIALKEINVPEAVKLFKLSAISSQTNLNQKALTYQTLADLYFNLPRPDYKNAQAYYDSTALIIPKTNPDYDRIQEKKEVLNELIGNLMTIQEQDSLLILASLPSSKLDKVLNQAIEDKKNQKEEPTPDNNPVLPGQNLNKPQGNSSWIFSNPTLLALGQAEFIKKWGDRKNTDYWRVSAKASEMLSGPSDNNPESTLPEESDSATEEALKNNPLMKNASAEKKAMLKKIPFSEAQKKTAEKKIAQALTDNGGIYYEKLGDKEEALNSLNKVMMEYPGYSGMDRVLYLVYKIKKEMGEEAEASKMRAKLIEKYPKSEYTRILNKSEKKSAFKGDASAVSLFFDSAYALFAQGQYAQARTLAQESGTKFPASEYQPRFDLLSVMAGGYIDSLAVYERNLKVYVSRYPNSEESEKAQRLLEAIARIKDGVDPTKIEEVRETNPVEVKQTQKANYQGGFSSRYFYVILIPTETLNTDPLKISISDHNRIRHGFEGLEIRVMQLDNEYQLVRVNEFKDKVAVKTYVDEMAQLDAVKKANKTPQPLHFGISEENFIQLFNTKDVSGYIDFYQKF